MNILHQTQISQHARSQNELISGLVKHMDELKIFAQELERKMIISQQMDVKTQEDFNNRFNQDIKSLESIQINQAKFLEKFEELNSLNSEVSNTFKNFMDNQFPALDEVLNRHIEVFRIAEQDHFNKIKSMLENAVQNRTGIAEELNDLKLNIENMKGMSETLSKAIRQNTIDKLDSVIKPFENELLLLKSHTESVGTSLYESESRLSGIKEQSEMIIKQMVITSENMESLEAQNSRMYEMFLTIQDLINEIDTIKADYVKAQSELTSISKEIKYTDEELNLEMKAKIEHLGNELRDKIDDSLDRLSKHYHLASKDISQNVEILAKKTKLKGYQDQLKEN
jgi:archaellum component FlaC